MLLTYTWLADGGREGGRGGGKKRKNRHFYVKSLNIKRDFSIRAGGRQKSPPTSGYFICVHHLNFL